MPTTMVCNQEELKRFELKHFTINLGSDDVLIRDSASNTWIGMPTEDGLWCLRFRNWDEEVVTLGEEHSSATVLCASQDLPFPLTITTEEQA